MGILVGLLKQIRHWDIASKVALIITLILLLLVLIVLISAPALRTPALIGGAGLLIALQLLVLWGNRNLVVPYTQAQRHFLDGDFEGARNVLKAYVDEQQTRGKTPTADSLVLLGNAYRNLGQLRESESVLRIAIAQYPHYHFALYGLGKVRLAFGDYEEAIKRFRQALQTGAPQSIRFDLAHALMRSGHVDDSMQIWSEFEKSDEVYRRLLAQYVLYKAGKRAAVTSELVAAGLPFWEAEIERFKKTPYAQAVERDVHEMRTLL